MGTFSVSAQLLARDGSGGPESVILMVDTGATYTCLPRILLERMGYRPVGRRQVVFANGTEDEWDVTVVTLMLLESTLPTLCFMAPDTGPRLLGAVTLEEFGLGVDPVGRRLIPVKTYLTRIAACPADSRPPITRPIAGRGAWAPCCARRSSAPDEEAASSPRAGGRSWPRDDPIRL